MFRKGFKYIVLFMIAGIFIYIWYMNKQQEQEKKEQILSPVLLKRPEYGTLERIYKISGYIESENTVTILPKISGTLTRLYKDVGDRVTKGELIAEIDNDSYQLSLKQAEAAYEAAKSTFERIEKLYKVTPPVNNATMKPNHSMTRINPSTIWQNYNLPIPKSSRQFPGSS